jgi:hypothetical protein
LPAAGIPARSAALLPMMTVGLSAFRTAIAELIGARPPNGEILCN